MELSGLAGQASSPSTSFGKTRSSASAAPTCFCSCVPAADSFLMLLCVVWLQGCLLPVSSSCCRSHSARCCHPCICPLQWARD